MAPYCQWIGETSDVTFFQQFNAKEKCIFCKVPGALSRIWKKFFFVTVGEDPDLGQVQGDDAHVEAAVKFVVALGIFPRAQEGAATHGAEDVAFIGFAHLLGRNVVGIHPFGRAFSSQLGQIEVRAAFADVVFVEDVDQFREGRRNVDVGVVLNPLNALTQEFFVNQGRFFGVFVVGLEIHEQGDERSLAVGRHEGC